MAPIYRLRYASAMPLLLLFTSCSMYAEQLGAPLDPADETEVVVQVPKGTTARSLGPVLEAAGVIGSADDFTLYVKLTKEGGCLKAGKFRVRRNMSAGELIETLCGVPLADDVPFTVVEGWRIREIDAALAAKGWIEAGAYAEAATHPERYSAPFPLPGDTLEGYLFPETYMVAVDRFTAEGFVQRQLDLLAEKVWTPAGGDLGGRDWADVVIVASMVEREERNPDNRPLVAGIIWKRLDNDWELGIDATSHYTLQDWNDRQGLIRQLKDPDDPYNTRLRRGLPPTAIGSASLESLVAALHPQSSEYWFYLHDKDGVLHPSRNAAEHSRARAKYDVY